MYLKSSHAYTMVPVEMFDCIVGTIDCSRATNYNLIISHVVSLINSNCFEQHVSRVFVISSVLLIGPGYIIIILYLEPTFHF